MTRVQKKKWKKQGGKRRTARARFPVTGVVCSDLRPNKRLRQKKGLKRQGAREDTFTILKRYSELVLATEK